MVTTKKIARTRADLLALMGSDGNNILSGDHFDPLITEFDKAVELRDEAIDRLVETSDTCGESIAKMLVSQADERLASVVSLIDTTIEIVMSME